MKITISEVKDGTMKHDTSELNIHKNRQKFLEENDCDPEKACWVRLTYDSDNFRRYNTVNEKQGGEGVLRSSTIIADALLTKTPGQALFLPLADCVGAVIYDKNSAALMVSHLGRHNLEQQGATGSVEYFLQQTGVKPSDVCVFLSPAAGKENYPLHSFGNRSMHEVCVEQLLKAGIAEQNITIDDRDTTTNPALFSHSNFLKGKQEIDGRQMIVAMSQ